MSLSIAVSATASGLYTSLAPEEKQVPEHKCAGKNTAEAKFALSARWEGWSKSQNQFLLLLSAPLSLINNPMHLIFPTTD